MESIVVSFLIKRIRQDLKPQLTMQVKQIVKPLLAFQQKAMLKIKNTKFVVMYVVIFFVTQIRTFVTMNIMLLWHL